MSRPPPTSMPWLTVGSRGMWGLAVQASSARAWKPQEDPRACGDDTALGQGENETLGRPPRVRGRHLLTWGFIERGMRKSSVGSSGRFGFAGQPRDGGRSLPHPTVPWPLRARAEPVMACTAGGRLRQGPGKGVDASGMSITGRPPRNCRASTGLHLHRARYCPGSFGLPGSGADPASSKRRNSKSSAGANCPMACLAGDRASGGARPEDGPAAPRGVCRWSVTAGGMPSSPGALDCVQCEELRSS